MTAWKLDETSGQRSDAAPTDPNTLSDSASVGYATGQDGNAASFVEANNQHLYATITNIAEAGADWSASFWLKHSGKEYGAVMGTFNGSSAGWIVFSHSDSTVDFDIRGTGGLSVANVSCTPNAWHHVYIEWVHSSSTIGISIDNGTPVTTDATGTGGYVFNSSFMIGYAPCSYYHHTELVDDVVFFSRVLTTTERTCLQTAYYPYTGVCLS